MIHRRSGVGRPTSIDYLGFVLDELCNAPDRREALAVLEDAYRTRLRRSGRSATHPVAVAELLLADGQPASVVLTGLLHDVLEDTDATADELRDRFGPRISGSVQALTQDASIGSYKDRKANLRQQILAGGPEVATVTLADKLAKLRERDMRPPDRKLAHYRATLEEVERRYGPSRLSRQLREQLARWEDT